MDRGSGYSKRTLSGCLLIVVLVMLCGALSTFTIDRLCYNTLTNRLPYYPGAAIVTERHNLFFARGMGETYVELYSTDPVETVREWYGQTVGRYQRQAIQNNDPTYRLASANRTVSRAEDGTGTMIQLYGVCAN